GLHRKRISFDGRGDWRFEAGSFDWPARGRRLQTCRRIRKYRLQVRPLARQRPNATRTWPGSEQAALAAQLGTSARRSIDRNTRSSSWPRRTIRPVAEITL